MQFSREATITQLFENMHAIKRGMSGHLMDRNCPITPSQLELLIAIHHSRSVSFKDLAQQLQLTPGAISQLADGLEQHEFIGRHADANDRRIQLLQLTKKGSALLDSINKRRQSIMEAVVHDLTDEELMVWLRIQEKMIRRFQSEKTKEETT